MIDIIIGAFIGSLAGALWVDKQCARRNEKFVSEVKGRLETQRQLSATSSFLTPRVVALEAGLQAALIQQNDIIKLIQKNARRRKTRKSHK